MTAPRGELVFEWKRDGWIVVPLWGSVVVSLAAMTAPRNPLSSPALSLDRLEIVYGSRRIPISPEEKQRFLAELHARCPHLEGEA